MYKTILLLIVVFTQQAYTQDKVYDPLAIAKGEIKGHSGVNKFGENSDIGANSEEDIWDGGGDYTFPTTADITHVSQAVDQAAMRGQKIEYQGLDANWNLVVNEATLDASDTTTAVVLANPLRRIFRMKVLADVVIDQNINAHNVGNTTTYATMQAGNNQTLMAIYTVPAGKTAYVVNVWATMVESTVKQPDSINVKLWVADRANGYEFQLKQEQGLPTGGAKAEHHFFPYMKVNEKNDIKISTYADGAAGHVNAGFDLILVDN